MVLATSLLEFNIGNFPLWSKSSGREYSIGLADFARIVGLPPHLEQIPRGSATGDKLQGGAVDAVRRSRRVRAIVIARIAPRPIFTRRLYTLMTGEVSVAAIAGASD